MSMDVPRPGSAPPPAPAGMRALAPQTVVVAVIVGALAFLGGMFFAETTDSPHNDDQFELFWQSWDILDDEFYYGAPEDETLIQGAIQGLLMAADDPYTFYAAPARAEFDRQQTAGEFGGIGADVSQTAEGYVEIVSPYDDYPAAEAGLQPQDQIREVDGTSLAGMSPDEAIAQLRGEVGTEVTLGIYRPSEERAFTVELTRARIELPTVQQQMFDDVGYARLTTFNGTAAEQLERAVADLLDQGAHSLILDLRGNPGGLLDQAVAVGDLFLDAGVVVKQRSRDGDEIVYETEDGDLAESIPLVVLIDGGSASASEVVAGALRDRDRATLVGQTTYGKGSVQHVHTLRDGSQVHVTYALWFTPDETPIQGQGLAPDIRVELPEDAEAGADPALDAALDHARTLETLEEAEPQTDATAEPAN